MDVIKSMKHHDMTLAVLFVLYLVFNIQAPTQVCGMFDNMIGNIIIAFIALYIFSVSNPIVGILGFLVAFQFISRCQFSKSPLKNVSNIVNGKGFVSPWKQQPITLEEEMVRKMAPLVVNNDGPQSDYKPVMNDQHGAVFVNDA
jgi:hypothetical protein